MFQEVKGGETPSAKALKRQLREYYSSASTTIKQLLERLLGVTFSDHYHNIYTPSHWGQFDDALCLATIYGLKFNIVTVELSEVFRVLHTRPFTVLDVTGTECQSLTNYAGAWYTLLTYALVHHTKVLVCQ